MNTELKYIMYARKSSESEDRQMESIDDQLKVLKDIAELQGLNVVEIIQEAKSAKKPGREGFGKVLEKINSGEADAILCWKLNRLSRNPIDGGSLSWMLQNSVIKAITTSERTHYPDENVILLAVEFGMANQFLNDLSKDTKRGLVSKAERGWYPCHAPMGYMMNPLKKKGEKEILNNPKQFDATRKIWDLVLSGEYNPWQAMQKVTKEYGLRNNKGKPYGKTVVYTILKNPFYYGEYEYPKKSGNWYKGNHNAMVTKQEFEKVQKLIGSTRKVNTDTKLKDMFMYGGPLTCGQCGCSVIGERKKRITCDCKYRFSGINTETCKKCKTHLKDMKNPKVEEHFYYHCTKKKGKDLCSQVSYSPDKVEAMIVERLKQFTLPKEMIEIGLEVIDRLNKSDIELRASSSKHIAKEVKQTESKLDQLLELFMNGDIDKTIYASKKKTLDAEKTSLEASLVSAVNKEDKNKGKYYFDFATDSVQEFSQASDARKKSIFYGLGSNQSLMDGKIDTVTDSALQELLEVCKVYNSLNEKARTSSEGLKQRKNTPFDVLNPVMLRGQGSNL